MNCRLCGDNSNVIMSHIVPEWAYKNLYNSKGHFKPISILNNSLGRAHQNGFKEPLLCADCDNRVLGKYDDYGKNFFYSIANDKYRNMKKEYLDHDIFSISGFDYNSLKLFFLSLIWRMSITQIDYFKEYKIAEYEQNIKQNILTESFTGEKYFPISISKLRIGNTYKNDTFMLFPGRTKINGIERKRIIIMGLIIDYFITENCNNEDINVGSLKEIGKAYILNCNITDIGGYDEIRERLISEDVSRYFGKIT